MPTRQSVEVLIVGAGAAGLSAAREFESKGITSLIILEASDRIGGRVHTCYLPSGNFFELGAQFIHGQDKNLLYEIAALRGLVSEKISVDGEGLFYTEEGILIDQEIVNSVIDFLERVKKDCHVFVYQDLQHYPPSVGHYFRAHFEEYLNECKDPSDVLHLKDCLYHWVMRWERADNACDSMYQLSAKRWGEYKDCGGLDNMNPKQGMFSVINSITNDIHAEIRLNSHVVCINYASDLLRNGHTLERLNGKQPIIVTCKDGSVFECQHVVVTSSLGYLKHHLNMFVPSLPLHLTEAVCNRGFGVLDKILLEYEKAWWSKDFIGLHLVWTNNIPDFDRTTPNTYLINGRQEKMSEYWFRAITGFDPVYGHPTALCAWIGGTEAEYMESLDEKEVLRTCTQLLRMFTNDPNIPNAKNIYISRWATNPLSLGSYSHSLAKIPVGKSYLKDLNFPVMAKGFDFEAPVLVLAGEANSVNQHSTVHGALANGKQQANHYIAFRERLRKTQDMKSKL